MVALCVLYVGRPGEVLAQSVPPIDLSTVSPSDFADDELDLPYYLAHFSRVANSVVMEGPNRGFIDIPIWRSPELNVPDNPRIMENVLALAYFYATDRPWNPYYGHPAVRARLEAALSYWVSLEHDDGGFSQSAGGESHLSPTAFATKFMGETLRLLETGPSIDADILTGVIAVQRRAIVAVLTDQNSMYAQGRRFTNQFTNVWGGVLAYLSLFAEPVVADLFLERFEPVMADFQSPAGYFYEHGGPDWIHDIETHHSNHRMAWHFLRENPLGDRYAESVRRWYKWLAYNTAPEPDGSGFAITHSFETRLSLPFYRENRQTMHGETCAPIAEVVVLARAFCESVEERADRLDKRRSDLEQSWPEVPPLELTGYYAYAPYAFLHRNHVRWHPTSEQKTEARSMLPVFESGYFTHLRTDNREPMSFAFVRRDGHYAVFSVGEQITPRQRFGLGLVWMPEGGAVLQSHSGSVEGAWGTRAVGNENVYETSISDPIFRMDSEIVAIESGTQDLRPGTFSVSYRLGDPGEKSISFLDEEIVVSVTHAGGFREHIPLLVSSRDDITLHAGRIEVAGETPFSITFAAGAAASMVETGTRSGNKRSVSVILAARDSLGYRLRFQ